VIFSGNFEDYVISYDDVISQFTVTHTTGTDGADYVIGVEKFQFADGMKTVGEVKASINVLPHIRDYAALYSINSGTKMFSGHTMGEWYNYSAFAALREDGSVVTWGYSYDGGDSSGVADKLNGSVDVVEIFSTVYAFAALRSDGSVVTWGASSYGGNSSSVANNLDGAIDVVQVFSTLWAFAALRDNGSVVTWGDSSFGGDSSGVADKLNGSVDVVEIFSTGNAFAALREDGSVVTWGDSSSGGDSSGVADKLNGSVDVMEIFSTVHAFAALREDGSVVTWGDSSSGGDSSGVADKLNGSVDIVEIFSTGQAFAALREDGSVVTWGVSYRGGDSNGVADKLNGSVDVVEIFSTAHAFAALREDGSVVTWGVSYRGGDSSGVADKLNGTVNVVEIFSTVYAFAALREDGSVVTWGSGYDGGDSSGVADKLNGSVDVVEIFSTGNAFAALREDGSVVTWGSGSYVGDSSGVADKLNGTVSVVEIFSTGNAFAALREDGSVVTWGSGSYGGNSSSVASLLHDIVDISNIYSNSTGDQDRMGTQDNDQMYGNFGNDILWGYDGNDVLSGWSGDDLVFGGAGNDLLICGEGEGNDTYDGGVGEDTVKYVSALAGITVDLATGTAFSMYDDDAGIGFDTLINIEHIIAGNHDDLLIGNDGANSIEAGSGNDTLMGGDGADTLDGGDGFDTADYSGISLPVIVFLDGSMDVIVSVGGVAADTIRSIENVIGGDGNDSLIGDIADNLSRGGDGKDTIDGGAGMDTADYSDKLESVTITLSVGSDTIVQVGGVAEDTIRNIENLIGGSGTDRLVGDNIANRLSGSAGNDTLEGGADNDTISGGFDDDTVIYTGNFPGYLFSYDPVNGIYTVTDSIAGRDGVDMVDGVEYFRFADGEHKASDLMDIEPPYLIATTPNGYANNVAVDSAVILTFSEMIHTGTGSIRLLADGEQFLVINITDGAQVSIDGTRLTIDPSIDLSLDTQYELQIDTSALVDNAGNGFVGLTGYEFKTLTGDHALTGTVTFWKEGMPIADVWGLLKEDGLLERVSGSGDDGAYTCQGLAAGDYTLGAEKEVDESDTIAVTADDALAALDLLFDDGEASPYQYLAADIDRDGKVGFRDTLSILKMALGRDDAPEPEWVIVSESSGSVPMDSGNVIWPSADMVITLDQDTEIDLVGVLMGDVDGSWGS
jgi:Ca2+-binding RTX toxin-like protein